MWASHGTDVLLERMIGSRCLKRGKCSKDRARLVTGASSGIGRAVAKLFGTSGAKVVVNYQSDRENAEAVVAEINGSGGHAFAWQADVSEESDVQALFAAAVERYGTVDVVVANAGLQRDAVDEMTLPDWRKVLDVNLTGQFLCAQAAIREFRRRGLVAGNSRAAGKIICMSSVHELIPWAGHVNYAASKRGVHMMMKSIAQEVAKDRIRINGIAPGAIKTDINRNAWSTSDAERQLLKLIPYGRVGDPEDIAKAALWLASDESDYVTGTTLFVDGGMALYPGFYENG